MATSCYVFVITQPESNIEYHGFILANTISDLFWKIDELANPYSAKVRRVDTDITFCVKMQTFVNEDDYDKPMVDFEYEEFPEFGESVGNTIMDSLNKSLKWRCFKDENTLVNFPVKKVIL